MIASIEDKGWEFFNQKQYDQAIETFYELLRTDPSDVTAFQGIIASLRGKGDLKKAYEIVEKVLNIHPENPGVLSEKALIYVKQKKHGEAIKAFNAVLKSNEKAGKIREESFIWKIQLLRDQHCFEEAEKAIKEGLKEFPGSSRFINEEGWLFFHQKHYDSAISTFEEVLKTDQLNESALQGLIASLRMSRQFTKANRILDRAFKDLSLSTHHGIRSESGWLNFEEGCYEEAEHEFEKALELKKDDPNSHVNLAWSLVRQDNPAAFKKATTYCQDALALDPHLAQAFGCLGVISFKRGHIPEAEHYLLQSIKVDPDRGHYTDLGALYIQMGRYDEAKEKLKEAVRNDPDDVYTHIQMGNLYLETDKIKDAIREFRWAFAADPDKVDSSRALAIALMENNKIDEAEKVLRNAIKVCPHEFRRWELHLTLCQLLTQLGDETDDALFYEEALKEISTVARMIKPDHPTLDFHGGIVRFKIGDYRGSLKNLQRCLRKLEKDKNRDRRYTEAELNAKRIRFLMDREKAQSRTSKIASIFLISVFLIHLIAIWTLRLLEKGNVSDTMLTVLVPILLGLIVVATLLPWLSRLKMTGLEAELSEPKPKETIASGRKGEIGFGSTLGTFW